MDWDAVAAIGEAVGALAVVVSVIYLALQVRKNTRMSIQNMVPAAPPQAYSPAEPDSPIWP